MSGLFGGLSIALRALLAEQGALATTADNISNVNTPGFTRRRPVLLEHPSINYGSLAMGAGVKLERVESIRDRVLELRIDQESQQEERLNAFLNGMDQIEALFNEAQGAGLANVIGKFFDSFQALSSSPASIPLRQAVLTAGENMAAGFRQATQALDVQQRALDNSVSQTVDEINQLTRAIAELQSQVNQQEGLGRDGGSFTDNRDLLIGKLSELVDVTVIETEQGLTLTTSTGAALVVGTTSIPLTCARDSATGLQRVLVQGADITERITGGKLAGVLELRDQTVPSVLARLDDLAAAIGNAVNTQHRAGFSLSGAAGGDFFVPFVPAAAGSNAGAASSLAMMLDDPAKLAASSDGAPGDNTNLLRLAGLRDQPIVNGETALSFYSGIVFDVGNRIEVARADRDAEDLVLAQLQSQRGAVSGVSLDEEAANLIRYQRAFEAAARVVAVVDEMLTTAVNLGKN